MFFFYVFLFIKISSLRLDVKSICSVDLSVVRCCGCYSIICISGTGPVRVTVLVYGFAIHFASAKTLLLVLNINFSCPISFIVSTFQFRYATWLKRAVVWRYILVNTVIWQLKERADTILPAHA